MVWVNKKERRKLDTTMYNCYRFLEVLRHRPLCEILNLHPMFLFTSIVMIYFSLSNLQDCNPNSSQFPSHLRTAGRCDADSRQPEPDQPHKTRKPRAYSLHSLAVAACDRPWCNSLLTLMDGQDQGKLIHPETMWYPMTTYATQRCTEVNEKETKWGRFLLSGRIALIVLI